MALSGADATTIATYLKRHGGAASGADDTATVALWFRSHWGNSGTDAAIIALYAEASRDPDLVSLAANIRLRLGGIS